MASGKEDPSTKSKGGLNGRSESVNGHNTAHPISVSKHVVFDTTKMIPVAKLGSVFKEEDEDYMVDTFTLTNESKEKYEFAVVLKNHTKYELIVFPSHGELRHGVPVTISLTLRVFCTTQISGAVDIIVSPKAKTKFFTKSQPQLQLAKTIAINFKVASEPSHFLDYDEIKIERKNLASGAFGVVSIGKWREIDVCVKTIPLISAPEEKKALEQEILVLEKIHCPYIVTYMGATRIPEQPTCLVMQYEKEGSLADVMERGLPLSDRFKCKILLDAAKGIAHLHANNIYHMDIKPANMVIASLDENATVNTKLIDFDLARFFIDDNYSMEEKGTQFGSISYAPPEALNREKHWRAGTYDCFSFGITMWEVLSEEKLYPGMKSGDIIKYVIAGYRPDVNKINPAFRSLVERCWHHDRKTRPQIKQVVAELETIYMQLPKPNSAITRTVSQPDLNPDPPPKSGLVRSPSTPNIKGPVLTEDPLAIGWVGDVGRVGAEDMLKGKGKGTFLFRWSDKAKSFVLSYTNKDWKVEHIGYITRGEVGDIVVSKENNVAVHYPSLLAYAAEMKNEGIINNPLTLQEAEGQYERTPAKKKT